MLLRTPKTWRTGLLSPEEAERGASESPQFHHHRVPCQTSRTSCSDVLYRSKRSVHFRSFFARTRYPTVRSFAPRRALSSPAATTALGMEYQYSRMADFRSVSRVGRHRPAQLAGTGPVPRRQQVRIAECDLSGRERGGRRTAARRAQWQAPPGERGGGCRLRAGP